MLGSLLGFEHCLIDIYMHLSFAGSLTHVGVYEADINGLHLFAVNSADIELLITCSLWSVLKLSYRGDCVAGLDCSCDTNKL